MMPYYPARDGHPSMFTLDDNAGAAIVEPIHSTIRTFRRHSPIALCGVRSVASVKSTGDDLESEARRSLQSQMPTASVTSDDLLVLTRRDSESCPPSEPAASIVEALPARPRFSPY